MTVKFEMTVIIERECFKMKMKVEMNQNVNKKVFYATTFFIIFHFNKIYLK